MTAVVVVAEEMQFILTRNPTRSQGVGPLKDVNNGTE